MKKRYRSLNHKKFKMKFHLIFSTKYRRKLFIELWEQVLASFKRAEGMQNDWKILLMEYDSEMRDHIHILLEGTPDTKISKVVALLKQTSTYDCWKLKRELMKKVYWGKKHLLWTKGYFCATIGEVSEKKIETYIKNQG